MAGQLASGPEGQRGREGQREGRTSGRFCVWAKWWGKGFLTGSPASPGGPSSPGRPCGPCDPCNEKADHGPGPHPCSVRVWRGTGVRSGYRLRSTDGARPWGPDRGGGDHSRLSRAPAGGLHGSDLQLRGLGRPASGWGAWGAGHRALTGSPGSPWSPFSPFGPRSPCWWKSTWQSRGAQDPAPRTVPPRRTPPRTPIHSHSFSDPRSSAPCRVTEPQAGPRPPATDTQFFLLVAPATAAASTCVCGFVLPLPPRAWQAGRQRERAQRGPGSIWKAGARI